METIEYLNHSFVRSFDEQEDRDLLEPYQHCLNCSMEVFVSESNGLLITYYHNYNWQVLELTCEEVIIKNILE